MANGATRIILAEMARPKNPKGSALKSVLDPKKMQNKLIAVKGNEKQPACK